MIGIGVDHGAFKAKEELVNFLSEIGYEVIDYSSEYIEGDDFPDYAFKVGEALRDNKIQLGIVMCTSGIGISIACNKVKGVRCAKVDSENDAIMSRKHNDANVIAMSGIRSIEEIKEFTKLFLETEFLNEERLIRRNKKIEDYENEH